MPIYSVDDAVLLAGFESGIEGDPVVTATVNASAWSWVTSLPAFEGQGMLRWTGDALPAGAHPSSPYIPQRFDLGTRLPGSTERQDLRIFAKCRLAPAKKPYDNGQAHMARVGIDVIRGGEVIESARGVGVQLGNYGNQTAYWSDTNCITVVPPCDSIVVFLEVQGGPDAVADWDAIKYLLVPYEDYGTPTIPGTGGVRVDPTTGVVVPPSAASVRSQNITLPHARESWVDAKGNPSRSIYTWAQGIDSMVPEAVAKADAAKAAAEAIPRQLGSADGTVAGIPSIKPTTVTGTGSIRANPSADGYVVSLTGDAASAEPTSYYGTDADGEKAFHPIADAFTSGEGIALTTDPDTGVTDVALAEVADTGAGAALVKVTRDAYGRMAGTEAAQAKDIPVHRHDQPSAASTWTINHNFGRAVDAKVYTVGGLEVWAGVLNVSDNQLQVLLAAPMAGYALVR